MNRSRPWLAGLALGLGACASTSTTPTAAAPEAPPAVVQYALESAPSGEQVAWHGSADGLAGTVTPLRTYRGSTGYCRDYAITVQGGEGAGGAWQETACRDADGRWRVAAN